uniref:Uncharacterized protein n=1 Tax=Sphaerodactylus townsendi TaxID=933632 RepID=A0ACB8FAA5_9SAUR
MQSATVEDGFRSEKDLEAQIVVHEESNVAWVDMTLGTVLTLESCVAAAPELPRNKGIFAPLSYYEPQFCIDISTPKVDFVT